MTDFSNLDPKLIKRLSELEKRKPEWQSVQALQDIASIAQELLHVSDGTKTDTQQIGVLLTDAHTQLVNLNNKELPAIPDFSKPVTEAMRKLEAGLTKELGKLKLDPKISVAAPLVNVPTPNVEVTTPKVDLSKIEKLLKTELPQAFADAINAIPKPAPHDNQPLIEKLNELGKQLADIDIGVRMKPTPAAASSSSTGGGTEYTDAAVTVAHPVGTMPVFDNGGTISKTSLTSGLPVNIVSGGGTGGGPADVASSSATSESDAARQKVTAVMRLYDTGAGAGSQLVTAKGDQTTGLWVNVKNTSVTVAQGTATSLKTQAEAYQGGAAVAAGNPLQVSLANTGANTNKLLVTPDSVALPANQSVNQAQVAGTATDTNSGVKSAGTQRIVIATDQPQLTNALKVDGSAVTQPVSGSVSIGNSPTVDTELTTGDLDTGAGTDTRAVVGLVGSKSGGGVLIPGDATKGLAVDLTNTGQNTTKLLVTPDSVALPANQSVNVSQINAVTPLLGSGASGTGALRVELANNGTGRMATVDAVTTITNNVNTVEVAPTTVLNGKKTVTTAGTRVTLAASTTAKSVTIKALVGNTGTIYVGDTGVASTNGFALAAGDTISLDISNLNTINLDSSVNGEGVTYIGVN